MAVPDGRHDLCGLSVRQGHYRQHSQQAAARAHQRTQADAAHRPVRVSVFLHGRQHYRHAGVYYCSVDEPEPADQEANALPGASGVLGECRRHRANHRRCHHANDLPGGKSEHPGSAVTQPACRRGGGGTGLHVVAWTQWRCAHREAAQRDRTRRQGYRPAVFSAPLSAPSLPTWRSASRRCCVSCSGYR